MHLVYCGQCGKENPFGQAYCYNCGMRLYRETSVSCAEKGEAVVSAILWMRDHDPEVLKSRYWIVSVLTGLVFFVAFFILQMPIESTAHGGPEGMAISLSDYLLNVIHSGAGFFSSVLLILGVLSFFLPLGSFAGLFLIMMLVVLDRTFTITEFGLDMTVTVGGIPIMVLMGIVLIVLGVFQLLICDAIDSSISKRSTLRYLYLGRV